VVGDQHASWQAEQHNIGYRLAVAGREVAEDGLLALLEADLRPAITPAPGRGSARLALS